ncbi:2Fe-2S iron-sulfur cluster-binding protein [Hoeflea poritis]|uniref:2Fe-2S iron-sulfur cluster-binding protein n=1 Tax=Hoeflea poritis TaxID=2993659 RepID=A0ABT4VI15_9HYPH|nr:2Fe-2S iron-sulfur cluster-binding protein [Hoeflea poritis]MDA4844323.1 2Fe-2S iron-sulfur cluster-binding protein [Hoeflea poritis]
MKRNLRMISGAVLFAFLTCHLLNVAFGLISVDAVEAARPFLTAPWTIPPIAQLLSISMLVHALLGLEAIYHRNTLRMSGYDQVQLISGLLIVPLLASHVVGIIGAKQLFQFDPDYHNILGFFWLDAPGEGLRQVVVVIVAWLHGSIGMFSWLRLKASWDRLSLFIYPLVVAVPVLALVGFVDAGNEVIAERQAAAAAQSAETAPAPDYTDEELQALEAAIAERQQEIQSNLDFLSDVMWTIIGVYAVLVAITFLARGIRLYRAHRNTVSVRYRNGPDFSTRAGASMLEIARLNDVPHANLCRGRGRCGTCRIRVLASDPPLPEPGKVEAATLKRLGLGPDIRLACQIVPEPGSLLVERLVEADIVPGDLHTRETKVDDHEEAAENVHA